MPTVLLKSTVTERAEMRGYYSNEASKSTDHDCYDLHQDTWVVLQKQQEGSRLTGSPLTLEIAIAPATPLVSAAAKPNAESRTAARELTFTPMVSNS